MTLFGRITQGSKTIMLFVQQSRARKRNIAIVAALLGVAVVWGAVWALTEQGLSASERVANSWSSLSRCLVGKPLGKGESPSARFRAVQMTAMTQAAAKRAAAKGKAETWPERCASYGHALAEALKDASSDEGPRQELAQAAAELASQASYAVVDSRCGSRAGSGWKADFKRAAKRQRTPPGGQPRYDFWVRTSGTPAPPAD